MRMLSQKASKLYYNAEMHSFPLKSPKFSEILVSKKKYKQVLVEESLESKNSKKLTYTLFSLYLFTLQTWNILLKIDSENERFKFHPREIYFVFLKQ